MLRQNRKRSISLTATAMPSATSTLWRISLSALMLAGSVLVSGCATHFYEKPLAPVQKRTWNETTTQNIRQNARDGDWIVARGYHLTDNSVAVLTNNVFSHAAMVDLSHDQVIEAEASGVHTTPLNEFVARLHRVMLVRPVWSTVQTGQTALHTAQGWIGRPYDFTGLIGLGTPERFYCSELALKAYQPFFRNEDNSPAVIEPGQLIFYGQVLYDTGAH